MKTIFFVLCYPAALRVRLSADDRVRITYASRSISSIMIFHRQRQRFLQRRDTWNRSSF